MFINKTAKVSTLSEFETSISVLSSQSALNLGCSVYDLWGESGLNP